MNLKLKIMSNKSFNSQINLKIKIINNPKQRRKEKQKWQLN